MRTALVTLASAAVALAFTSPGQAKEPTKVTVWGISGSVTIEHRSRGALLPGGWPLRAIPRPAPFYTVAVDPGHDARPDRLLMLYVPSDRRIARAGVVGGLEWFRAGGATVRALDAAAADLRPYQAGNRWPPELRSVDQLAAFAGARTAPTTTGTFPWGYVVGAALAAAGVATTSVLLVRRRLGLRAGRPRPA